VLVALYGSIGKLGVARLPVATNQAIACAIPDPDRLDPMYLFHCLRSMRDDLVALGSGVTQKNIYLGDLKSLEIPVAPRAEQSAVVQKLEDVLSELDAGVAELQAAQKKLTQYRQSLLKAAVEGDLTAEWRAGNPPQETGAELLARILRERRARWEARQRKFVAPIAADAESAGPLPDGWVRASIDELAEVGTGVTPLRTNDRYFDGGNIPWVTSGALNAERVTEASMLVTEAALAECRLVLYPAGALLVAMYGEGKTRGKCAELGIAATINQAIAALVFDGSAVACREYVKAFLWNSYERMRQQASGGVQPNLNLQIIKALAVPLPPLAEQAAIVAELNARLESVRDSEAAIAHGLRMAAAQRQNILRAAFTGQLVPQDPNDEPASALLARIRAQRAAHAKPGKPPRRAQGAKTAAPA
jgi:type I restriction enzyme, S subunit